MFDVPGTFLCKETRVLRVLLFFTITIIETENRKLSFSSLTLFPRFPHCFCLFAVWLAVYWHLTRESVTWFHPLTPLVTAQQKTGWNPEAWLCDRQDKLMFVFTCGPKTGQSQKQTGRWKQASKCAGRRSCKQSQTARIDGWKAEAE